MKTKHTPTPEELQTYLPILIKSGSENGRQDMKDWAVKNSERIVHAVNCHAELVEACKEALAWMQDPKGWENEHTSLKIYLPQILREAIAHAEGKGE